MSKEIETCHKMFGLRIRQLRDALGKSQQEVATAVGLDRTSVVNIEGGRQRVLLDDVEAFSRAFGCTPKHLLKGIWL